MSINTIKVISINQEEMYTEDTMYGEIGVQVSYKNVKYTIIYQTNVCSSEEFAHDNDYCLETVLECNQALMTALVENEDAEDSEEAVAYINAALKSIIDTYRD
jgi:Fe-S-cluster formation regulator IscX/YfhJ